jgi:hypothetical protein
VCALQRRNTLGCRLLNAWAFVLQVMQGGVLASSPALAAAAVNQQAVTCLCGHHPPGEQ